MRTVCCRGGFVAGIACYGLVITAPELSRGKASRAAGRGGSKGCCRRDSRYERLRSGLILATKPAPIEMISTWKCIHLIMITAYSTYGVLQVEVDDVVVTSDVVVVALVVVVSSKHPHHPLYSRSASVLSLEQINMGILTVSCTSPSSSLSLSWTLTSCSSSCFLSHCSHTSSSFHNPCTQA